jgi:predicted DNA-binding transcriptional regulator AlpA
MQTQPTVGFLRLRQIIGQTEITPAQAESNREAHKAAIAAGKKPQRRPLRPRPAIPGLLNVSATTFWGLVKQGIIPAPIKLGGSSLWPASAITGLTPETLARAKPQSKVTERKAAA